MPSHRACSWCLPAAFVLLRVSHEELARHPMLAAGEGLRVPHTRLSLYFTIRRKRNSPALGVGSCREASSDRKHSLTAFPWGCPPQALWQGSSSSGAAWRLVPHPLLLSLRAINQQQQKATRTCSAVVLHARLTPCTSPQRPGRRCAERAGPPRPACTSQ